MKKRIFALLCIAVFCSHDMYLKMDTYFLKPNEESKIQLFNGTFDKSENVIDRERMLDVSLVGNGKRTKVEDDQWSDKDSITILSFKSGNEGTWVAGLSTKTKDFAMTADEFNEYLEHDGVLDMLAQRKANNTIEQDAVERYSKHVKAIFQVGDQKSEDWNTVLGYPIEFVPMQNPYDLHTGAVLKVKLLKNGAPLANQLVYADFKAQKNGHSHDDSDEHAHGSTAESHSHSSEKEHSHDDAGKQIQGNETHSHANEKEHSHANGETHSHSDEKEHAHTNGETHSHSDEKEHTHANGEAYSHSDEKEHTHSNGETHSHSDEKEHAHENEDHQHDKSDENHTHTTGQQLRTDSEGIIDVTLTNDGIWFLRTINLVTSEEEGLTHESNWATLTFETKHSHSHTEIADHSHEEEGIPSYLFWVLSAVVVAILFFWFNRKK